MECGGTGGTRMLTTKIPFFREIIICSFECDSCHSTNNEVVIVKLFYFTASVSHPSPHPV